ncbi:hypothetical protein KSP40_PGU019578 [Platanthera guangdongensis]|uniref:Bifunctional inhibitor/plant lipid transfer protein/seed storage helical domain-containing protein n=1 Tax=Platanthera guangdongensis TaxID=2320717 RepID=A0ABR2MM10_9ASPA
MKIHSSAAINASLFLFFFFFFISASGQQISMACTNSIISSFTPCLNFLASSTNGGGSPSAECCSSLAAVINRSAQCSCLILTGSVPLTLPINKVLAISLPRLCKNRSVPLKCSTDVGTLLPGPGPISNAPSIPPFSPQPSTCTIHPPSYIKYQASVGGVDSPPPSVNSNSQSPPAVKSPPSISSTPANQGANQGEQPLILPNSAVKISNLQPFSIMVASVLLGIYLF